MTIFRPSYTNTVTAPRETLYSPLVDWAWSNGQTRVISRHQQARLSYDGLDQKSNALARGLLERGVEKGDRVAVSLGNNIEYAIV